MVSRISVDNVTMQFQMAYNKSRSVTGWAGYAVRRLLRREQTKMFTALKGISLTIDEGEIVGIIGPNGCGKTTLLRTIAGIYHPNEGNVTRRGSVSTLLSLGSGFDKELSGIENIRLNGLTIGMTPAEIDHFIPQIVDFAEIGEHINEPMKYYSSGMLSRLSFGIVLAIKSDILLIDEIMAVGDIQFRQKSTNAMEGLLERSTCQLIVTHSLSFVKEHCNRAIYMRKGQVMFDGDPVEAVEKYEADAGTTFSD